MIAAALRQWWTGAPGGSTPPSPVQAMRSLLSTPRFAELLPHAAWQRETGLFVLDTGAAPGALGFVLEMVPQTGASEEMASILLALLTAAPPGAELQASLYASPAIAPQLRDAARLRADGTLRPPGPERRGGNLYLQLARRRMEHYLHGAWQRPIPHLPCLIRRYRLVLSVQLPGQEAQHSERLLALRAAWQATLRSAGFASRIWTPLDLIIWCRELLSPHLLATHAAAPTPAYDPGRLLRDQIIASGTVCRPTDDGAALRYGWAPDAPCESRLYTVQRYPAEFPLWAMGHLVGDLYQHQLGYPCPFLIAMGARVLDAAALRDRAQLRGARATSNATSPMARFLPDYQQIRRDWEVVNASYGDGLGEIELFHHLLLIAPPDQMPAAEMTAGAVWKARGFELANARFMQVPALLSCLPLGHTQPLSDFYRRGGLSTRKVSANAVNLAPMIADWQGTKTPVIQLISRRGQLMGLDLFDNQGGNYNFAVAAVSGAGKSVFANEIIVSYHATGASIAVVDNGRSYQKICEHLGGTLIDPGLPGKHAQCFNPFAAVADIDEELELLKPLLGQMAAPQTPLTDLDRALLEIAIRHAWKAEGPEMSITSTASVLASRREREARRLATQLFPWTRDGMYGCYVEGKPTVDLTVDFLLAELESLNTRPDLRSVLLFLIMHRRAQQMYHGGRRRRWLTILDEAGDQLDGANSGKFIDAMYRRARKYDGAIGTLTQMVDDYYKNPAAEAALANADWLFLLKQKEESIEKLASSGRLLLDEGQRRLLKSVHTEHGLYSEIFIHSPCGTGIGRLILDPFSELAYSTSPADWRAVEAQKARGLDVGGAIDAVLAERAARSAA